MMFALFVGSPIISSNIIKSISDNNLRFMAGLFFGILGSWIVFYLSVFIWRKFLVSIGFMTKEEAKRSPFYIGFELNKSNHT